MFRYTKVFFFLAGCLWTVNVVGQNLTGSVTSPTPSGQSAGEALPGANLFWLQDGRGVSSDNQGQFSLALPITYPDTLIVRYIGFQDDTLIFSQAPTIPIHVQLRQGLALDEVEVSERVRATQLSTLTPNLVETIGTKELEKAACCNISESFETNASVDVAASDAVSGSKKIRMLGLDGVYSALLLENIPWMTGLQASSAFGRIPGTWVESIQISKGAGSVVNGYSSLTGQINLQLLAPDKVEDRVFVNLYGNTMGRGEANVHLNQRMGDKWSSLLLLHGSGLKRKNDVNNDQFLDTPLRESYQVLNRWKYKGERYRAQFGVQAYSESLQAGQTSFKKDEDLNTTNAYGVSNTDRQVSVFAKSGRLYPIHDGRSLGLQVLGSWYEHDAYYGTRRYKGEQYHGYANFIWQEELGSAKHQLTSGASYHFDEYDESFVDSAYSRMESVPGVYTEYTFNDLEHLGLAVVGGLRADYHNLFGLQVNPRMHIKYNLKPETAIRLSGGRGFRTANVLLDNASTLVSSRQVRTEEFDPEIAWNMGASLVQEIKLLGREGFLSIDYFYTWFENQVVVDREEFGVVRFYNLDGQSYSHSLQVEGGIEPVKGLDIKAAYKWYRVRTDFQGTEKDQPLIPRHRALLNTSYSTAGRKWSFDATLQWFGTSRIPSTSQVGSSDRSPDYFQVLSQVTKRFKHIDLYAGVENLLDYRQSDPILGGDDPFGPGFDAALVWGPVRGRIVYSGIRFKI